MACPDGGESAACGVGGGFVFECGVPVGVGGHGGGDEEACDDHPD